jgi:hypothetical protein
VKRLYRCLAVFVAVVAVTFSAWLAQETVAGEYRPDFAVLWTAAQVALRAPGRLYDSSYMTAAQSWLTSRGPRPYAYPPSALIAFLPFSAVPFWPALVAWNAISLAAFIAAARPYARPPLLVLAVLAPPTMLALALGQTSLLVGAAALFGMSQLNKRPVLTGIALGVAAVVKPQTLILAPILLSTERRALISFLGSSAAVVLASLALGPRLWCDWIAAMPSFMHDVDRLGLVRWGATPSTLAAWLGFGRAATSALQAGGLVAGVSFAFWARTRTPPERLTALIAGGLFCSPYAMSYDMAALMPVAATALFSETLAGFVVGLTMLGSGAITLLLMAGSTVGSSVRASYRPAFPQQSTRARQ